MTQPKTALNWINNNWRILALIIGLIITWTQLNTRVGANEVEIAELKVHYSKVDLTLLQIQKDLVEIRTSLKFIEQNVK